MVIEYLATSLQKKGFALGLKGLSDPLEVAISEDLHDGYLSTKPISVYQFLKSHPIA